MKKWIIVGIIALVLLGLAGGFFFTHSLIDGEIVYNKTTSLDLSHREIRDIGKICKLKNLKVLNLEGTGLTVDQYETLRTALPGCEIRWEVPIQGSFYAPDTTTLKISDPTSEDIHAMDYLPGLAHVDATACRDYQALALLQSRHPNCVIFYSVDLGGQTLPDNATALVVEGVTVEEVDKALSLLPGVTSIRISGCPDALGLKALAEKYPGCQFTYDITIGNQVFSTDAEEITLRADELPALEAVLPCFTSVKDVTVTGEAPQAHALADAYPDIRFHYGFQLLGVSVHTDREFIDLSGIEMTDTTALEEALPYFHNLTKVDMINCGLKNEVMGDLNDRYPKTLFVWEVRIGYQRYRTDITVFYPTGDGNDVTDMDISNLKYCTELVAVDLGHFKVQECSFLEYMPNLKYLVLAIGTVSDIRPIGTLKELKYLELFDTRVRDYWPLINCTKLEALNLSFSGHGEIEPLLQMPWLTHLWLCSGMDYFTKEEKAALEENLPNTIIVFYSESSTNRGWRNSPVYYAMRDYMGARYMFG